MFWPGEFHGLYSPWGRKEADTTEQLSLTWYVYSVMSLLTCGLSLKYLSIIRDLVEHYKAMNFPKRVICGQNYISLPFLKSRESRGQNREAGGDHGKKDETKPEKEAEKEKKEGTEFPCSL